MSIDRRTGNMTNYMDPRLYGVAELEMHSGTYNAVHHSLDGRHLIAAGDSGEIVWIRNYRDFPKLDPSSRRQSVVVMRVEAGDADWALINQLAVENDRGELRAACQRRTSGFARILPLAETLWDFLRKWFLPTP